MPYSRPLEYRMLDDGTWGIAVWGENDYNLAGREVIVEPYQIRLTSLVRTGAGRRPALYRYVRVGLSALPTNTNVGPTSDLLVEDEADEWMTENGHSLVN